MIKPLGWVGPLLLATLLAALACSPASNNTPESSPSPGIIQGNGKELVPRFLTQGWTTPKGEESGPFAETLKASVVTTEDELTEFLDGLHLFRLRGSLEALNRTDLEQEIILAAYYLWRPLKGDPISLERIALNESEVQISLQLLENPQGKESPFLMAPLYITALNREDIPRGIPLKFVFLVNGEAAATRSVTLE